jgi:hypothetical protein
MESRTATQLGENVKLLTYVSIFFLPLSFCTVSPDFPPFSSPGRPYTSNIRNLNSLPFHPYIFLT